MVSCITRLLTHNNGIFKKVEARSCWKQMYWDFWNIFIKLCSISPERLLTSWTAPTKIVHVFLDLCNNRIIIINTNFFIFSGKSLMEDKNVYTLPKMGSQNPDLLWNSICERRKVPVMCLQIWGSPLSSSRIKIGPDIQTCYKVVSGGRAYSTLSFHDNVDTGSLWKQANSSTKVFYFQSCHYNHLYNKGFWANWGTIKKLW